MLLVLDELLEFEFIKLFLVFVLKLLILNVFKLLVILLVFLVVVVVVLFIIVVFIIWLNLVLSFLNDLNLFLEVILERLIICLNSFFWKDLLLMFGIVDWFRNLDLL